MITTREIRHFHLFCGIGGGAKGFNKANPRVGNMVGKMRCLGGIDVSAAAIKDFSSIVGVPGTVMDLFDRDQYIDFHGNEPPAGWVEASPRDILKAAGHEHPHIVFLSAPCKGFSGLLPEGRSRTNKYQALNRLTVRGVWLMLEAFKDSPPELIVFENVPRIANRGRPLLDQISGMLSAYGYAVAETTHDCGELGGLAQSRKRFLLVARHVEKVPPFLYEPEKKRLQSVGALLGRMPLPGDLSAGPMHRIPSLQWKTWVRLAFVEAGSDWRSLNKLAVEDGYLRDYLIVPDYHAGYLGVRDWNQPTGTIAGHSSPTNGAYSVADPRFPAGGEYGQLGIRKWDEPTGTVTSQRSPIQGAFSVADPRHHGPAKHSNEFRIVPWSEEARAITGAHGTGQCVADPRGAEDPATLHGKYPITEWKDPTRTVIAGAVNGAYGVADPRPGWNRHSGNLAVMDWDKHSSTVIAGGKGVQGGWLSVADPRTGLDRGKGDHYLTGGHYGVVPWDQPCGAVSASAGHDNGRWSVADPRLPAADEKMVAVIRARDGTWHRPFTTMELAVIQSLVEPEEFLHLEGMSDTQWREHIGNLVPPAAAEAIAEVFGVTLLLAWSGETFVLSSTPIWVQPVAIALSVAQR